MVKVNSGFASLSLKAKLLVWAGGSLGLMAATARSYEMAILSMETNSERLLNIGRSLETVSNGFLMLAHGNREKAYD